MTIGTLGAVNNTVRNINPAKIGYLRPDKTIKFLNQSTALEYAKNAIVRALNEKDAFERCVLINKDTIVKEIDGKAEEVEFNTDGLTFDTMLHGHPDVYGKGKTHPINFHDIAALFENYNNGARKSIVYNSVGEYSQVEVLPPHESYDRLMPEVKEAFIDLDNRKHLARAYRLDEEEESSTIKKLFELKSTGKIKDFAKDVPAEGFITNLLAKIKTVSVHEMIQENSKKLGIEYKTNFSNIDKF